MHIDWESDGSQILLNPSYNRQEQLRYAAILREGERWNGHLWFSTSGSSAQKWVGLSKNAVLASAEAVNHHLESTSSDSWINALPPFHVGGLGIQARAYLSGAKCFDFTQAFTKRWHADDYYNYVKENNGTLSALVPAQLHDLVALGKEAPPSLRAIVIGGGALLPILYEQAKALGWPILPSYGLTECASQVATATLGSLKNDAFPELQILSHMKACERQGRLCFFGPSLLSVYAFLEDSEIKFVDPKIEGWLMSEDRGRVIGEALNVHGRVDGIVKVGGENVDMSRLECLLQTLCAEHRLECEFVLLALPDQRLGHRICCVSTPSEYSELEIVIERFQQSVLPFERIRKVVRIPHFPRSPLGKILSQQLKKVVLSMCD